MNEKIYISRKYNKLLNILLGIYVTLCLVLSLLYNGFFVKTRAINIDSNYNVGYTLNLGGRSAVGNLVIDPRTVDNNRLCVCTDPDLITSFEKSNRVGGVCIAFRNVGILSNTNAGNVYYALQLDYSYFNEQANSYLNNFDSSYSTYMSLTYIPGICKNFEDNIDMIQKITGIEDIGWVDNLTDLRAYMKDNDETVVNYTDPDNPPDPTIDNSLPVPQNVHFLDDTINKETGEIYNLKIGWDNPSNASFDALDSNKLKIQIKVNAKSYYVDGIVNKPSNRVYNNFDTSNEFYLFNPLMKQNLNAYFSRGSENDGQIKAKYEEGYGEYLDEGYCFYQDIKLSNEYQNIGAPSQRSQLIAGTTIKIRYKYEDNVSLWVNLRLSKNPTTWTDLPLYTDTSFTDNQDNNVEVSSNASGNGFYYNSNPYSPYYNSIVYPNPNSSNKNSSSSNSSSSSSGLGNILSGIGSIFGVIGEFFSGIFTGIGELVSSIKDLFSGENDSGGFFGFFGSLFQEFPFLLTFLTLGIAITVLLRIIGR